MEKTYCIYCHTNRVNGKKYIGMTSQSLKNRWRSGRGYKGCTEFDAAIKQFGWEAFDHEILGTNLSLEMACKAEKHFIEKLGSRFPNGYNLDGGGIVGRNISAVTKTRIGDRNRGRHPTEETRKKMSVARRGIEFSDKTREKLSVANLGKTRTKEQKNRLSEARKNLLRNNKELCETCSERMRFYGKEKERAVFQYTKDDVFVKRHDSVRKAAESVGGKHSNICKCCRGEKKSMYGYVWKYEDTITRACLAKEVI